MEKLSALRLAVAEEPNHIQIYQTYLAQVQDNRWCAVLDLGLQLLQMSRPNSADQSDCRTSPITLFFNL
jgi:hypothetical protein